LSKREKPYPLPFGLKGSDLRYWDTNANEWTLEPGKIEFFTGSSSSDVKLKGNLIVK